MSHEPEQRDLFVLVADQDMIETMKSLLDRPESLEIRPIKYAVDKHLQRDTGCRNDAPRRLRPYIRHYRYALVLFDKHGFGQDNESREDIQYCSGRVVMAIRLPRDSTVSTTKRLGASLNGIRFWERSRLSGKRAVARRRL